MKTAIVPFLLLLNVLVAVNAQTKDSVILVKDSITVKLPDVYVTSERPLVTVTDDALSFDVPNLIMAKPVNTAFDILGEIPGLVKEGDNVSIIGVPATNIIINGRRSSMSLSQIVELLKSICASGSAIMMTTHNLHLLSEYPGIVYRFENHQIKEVTNEYSRAIKREKEQETEEKTTNVTI